MHFEFQMRIDPLETFMTAGQSLGSLIGEAVAELREDRLHDRSCQRHNSLYQSWLKTKATIIRHRYNLPPEFPRDLSDFELYRAGFLQHRSDPEVCDWWASLSEDDRRELCDMERATVNSDTQSLDVFDLFHRERLLRDRADGCYREAA